MFLCVPGLGGWRSGEAVLAGVLGEELAILKMCVGWCVWKVKKG
jgi:hypothetical protein